MFLVSNLIRKFAWLRRSSMLRLSLLLSAIFAVGMAVALFVALSLGRDAIAQRADTTLEAFARSAILEDAEGQSPSLILRPLDDLEDLPRPFRRAVQERRRTVELDGNFLRSEVWRILVTQDSRGTPVIVAVPLEESEDALELLSGILWTTAALVIGSTIAIGVGAGFFAQRRLSGINTTLGQLAAGDLTARTGLGRSKDDLDDIARQLDRTASELERIVAQTRHLGASIAHDLRTPLARLRARLEMLPDSEERAEALEEAGQLSDIFDTIMRVARIEAGQGKTGFEDIPLASFIDALAETFGPVVEDAGRQLKLDVSGAKSVFADRQMLVQAMANLIQNALVHGGSEIALIANGQSLGVADNGDGVKTADYDEIVKPMVRLDAARSSIGSGLGLALVRAVADRHGAKLDLGPMQPGQKPQGLRVMLNFADL
ncbi:sensor histidine kinase [Yoonia sp.]|uniref:sensor histidine kinase n=1 Tax=Yoonia sp. TaxID=2212373 RepID=UPI0035C85802